ncbi:hypothetical protein [Ciceribacter thiooxidans]|uniref:Uncharacterized protein n=1 Tax=Ciceribacter thiooxidans TaxID=1969821 RepID=A0ABV7I6E7_9HYPH|nr:hypothetical protein [Ciceribacter thiooxidans]
MYLKNLINAVASLDSMPIEVEELTKHIIAAGCQDSIIFHPVDEDPGAFQGLFYQYTTHAGVYSTPDFVTLIVFSKHLPLEWQRLVCCKELIHACDSDVERTNTADEVEALLEKVLGPLTSQDFGLADLMAAKDKLAIYQALALLFPPEAWAQALAYVKAADDEAAAVERVARWACIPKDLVAFALTDDWPSLRTALLDSWGE